MNNFLNEFFLLHKRMLDSNGLVEDRYFDLFSQYSILFNHTNNQLSTSFNFLWAKFGSEPTQNMQQISFGGFIEWEISVYFCPLLVLSKALLILKPIVQCSLVYNVYFDCFLILDSYKTAFAFGPFKLKASISTWEPLRRERLNSRLHEKIP